MTLPSSPPITLSAIQNEFSATSLEDARIKAGLSSPVSMLDFLGLSAKVHLYDRGTQHVTWTSSSSAVDFQSNRIAIDLSAFDNNTTTEWAQANTNAIDMNEYSKMYFVFSAGSATSGTSTSWTAFLDIASGYSTSGSIGTGSIGETQDDHNVGTASGDGSWRFSVNLTGPGSFQEGSRTVYLHEVWLG